MTKFLVLYRGSPQDMSSYSEEESSAIMKRWEEWGAKIGDSLLNFGNPTASSANIVDDGSTGTPADVTGYSIIEADYLDAAKELIADHPYLIEGKGNYSIDIFELVDM